MQIRPARPTDADEVAALMTQLGYPTPPEEMQARLGEILSRSDYYTIVAVVAERVVGVAGVRIGPQYERPGWYGHLSVLAVDESHRGQGTGRLLVQEVERWLREHGVGVVIVNSGKHRADAHRFYQRLGYVATGLRFVKTLPPG